MRTVAILAEGHIWLQLSYFKSCFSWLTIFSLIVGSSLRVAEKKVRAFTLGSLDINVAFPISGSSVNSAVCQVFIFQDLFNDWTATTEGGDTFFFLLTRAHSRKTR